MQPKPGPGGVAPIAGVATSIAAFIGSFSRGPLDEARPVCSVADLDREFGGLHADSLASYAVRQFFQNGGREAYVVRVASPAGAERLIAALAALDDVDLVNLLSIPDTDQLAEADAMRVAEAATAYAAKRCAFYILDPPNLDVARNTASAIEVWLDANRALRHPNVAIYLPRTLIADPPADSLRVLPPSGAICGIYARTDAQRGVWKAPAGMEADLREVVRLEHELTDADGSRLKRIGVNALRTLNGTHVCWGARTLVGAQASDSEWKYVPVRRFGLFLEESLHRGTRFAVFEPNDEPLWSAIRRVVGDFLQSLFTQGALQGTKPSEAYFVRCDRTTMTQGDIDRGIVNIVVGFAPLRPAEFVVITIRQVAGQPKAA